VESLSSDGTTATVTLTDDGTDLGATATVYKTSSTLLGSGKLEINRPYYVPATTGTVSKIYVSVDSKVSTRTKLAYLMGKDVSDTYASLEKTLAQEQGLLKKALDLQRSGVLTAPQDGTVKSLSIVDGQAVKQDGAVALMLTLDSYELDVSVDELDINSVSVGQDASVAVDAVSSKTFDGAVQSISQIGSTSNGVTTYTVAIKMAADSSLKVGMNATATIVIEKHANVLLMPIEALNTIMGNSYVWLYTGTLPTDSSKDPGTRTEVKTGLSNDNYVEITSGLTASDQVVVVRTKSTTGTTTTSQNSIFSGMGGMGGTMPSGVQMPSGGFPGGGSGGN
jgi:HlyD family secretion protein